MTIGDATPGATIYYTTNGSTPTTSSPIYAGPIAVSGNETVAAIAVATGYPTSAAGTAAYTINTTPAATPTFSPGAGIYTSSQTVTIGDTTPGATIYYTTNGSTPTTSSQVYTGPITVSGNETVAAIAAATGYPTSPVGAAAYTINTTPAATPTFSPGAGTYTSSQSVTIGDATPGATIYYTTNGSTPTTSSQVYAGPITVPGNETVAAIAAATGYPTSAVGAAAYTINTTPAATPTFSPGAGIYTSSQTVTIGDTTPGATIYYTTNGSTPTTSSQVYTGPITVSGNETVAAVAVASGYPTSAVGAAAYTMTVATPSFSVAVSPGALSLAAGHSGTVTVMVTPQNSFSSPLTLSCTGLPSGVSYSFSPATVTPAGGVASTALTITTSTSTPALRRSQSPLLPGSALAVALCFFARKRRRGLQMLMLALAAIGLSVCSGCGSNVNSKYQAATKVTTSTVTIIATSGSTQLTTTFTLALEEVE